MVQERDYPQLTPEELNAELRRYFSLFPQFGLFVLPRESSSIERIRQFTPKTGEELLAHLLASGTIEAEERRAAGEVKAAVFSGIERLSRYSKTTGAFWPILIDELDSLFDMGIVEGETADETDDGLFGNLLPILLDEENPESGGVFEINSAIRIERRCFRIIKRQREEVSNLMKQLLQERTDEEIEKLVEYGFFGSDKRDIMFEQWQAAVIEKYGDEP